MRIAFYAPMKAPDHPVPSGDRLMARQLIAAMTLAGHRVTVASGFRSFAKMPDPAADAALADAAAKEADRLAAGWESGDRPDLWFCYHPYYKAPDLLGPALARRYGIAYVTAESSVSPRRDAEGWGWRQDRVRDGLTLASANICFTARDEDGIRAALPAARIVGLKPFLDTAPFAALTPAPVPGRLITVAMMRPGDKLQSYRSLAESLALLPAALPWHLTVVGDGALRAEVEALFAALPPDRLGWAGQRSTAEIAALLGTHALYLWPGWGEAYGLAYLEAQACGLPVVAQAVAGVPEVVRHGVTGLLTAPGDAAAYAAAVARLLADSAARTAMAAAARDFVLQDRSLTRAAVLLDTILSAAVEG